jgi:hypothetical protein
LLDALERGEPVTVGDWQLGSRRVPVPKFLLPGKSPGKWWRGAQPRQNNGLA